MKIENKGSYIQYTLDNKRVYRSIPSNMPFKATTDRGMGVQYVGGIPLLHSVGEGAWQRLASFKNESDLYLFLSIVSKLKTPEDERDVDCILIDDLFELHTQLQCSYKDIEDNPDYAKE